MQPLPFVDRQAIYLNQLASVFTLMEKKKSKQKVCALLQTKKVKNAQTNR